jgi:hypothetical protein
MSGDLVWYFAYGSNTQSATLRGRRGIVYRRAVPVRVRGWRLVFDKPSLIPEVPHGFANIRRDAAAVAIGVAFEMTADDLAHVELSEGVTLGNYARVMVDVEPLVPWDDGPRTAASLSSERTDPARRPSIRYMDIVIAGALEHGLPDEHVAFLRGVVAEPEHPKAIEMRALLDDWMRRR